MATASPLRSFQNIRYAAVKAQHPGDGRRRWNLRVAHEFWNLTAEEKAALPIFDIAAVQNANFVTDDDPWDSSSNDRPELGIVLRTDFSNESAWKEFCDRIQQGEMEFRAESTEETIGDSGQSPATGQDDEAMEEDDDEDDGDEDEESLSILYIINPSSPKEKNLLTNISNLSALRLLNDVDVRTAPPRPSGTPPFRPPNRIVDHDSWQEIYTGKNLWIYDARSNTDQCVRVVSPCADMYGTATGDSWRARVSHICELQVNLSSNAIRIDFGGLDRWDYRERQRNLEEASQLLISQQNHLAM